MKWEVETTETWRWNNDNPVHEIRNDDGRCVAEHVYKIEDARLIAAAPDLLSALQYCIDCLGCEFALPNDCIIDAEKAIEKALNITQKKS